jgi:hypothetical protein
MQMDQSTPAYLIYQAHHAVSLAPSSCSFPLQPHPQNPRGTSSPGSRKRVLSPESMKQLRREVQREGVRPRPRGLHLPRCRPRAKRGKHGLRWPRRRPRAKDGRHDHRWPGRRLRAKTRRRRDLRWPGHRAWTSRTGGSCRPVAGRGTSAGGAVSCSLDADSNLNESSHGRS